MLQPTYKPGDRIRLNEKAREWTRGYVFTVDAVRPFGVRCYLPQLGGGEYYTAMWDEIAGKAEDAVAVELRGM